MAARHWREQRWGIKLGVWPFKCLGRILRSEWQKRAANLVILHRSNMSIFGKELRRQCQNTQQWKEKTIIYSYALVTIAKTMINEKCIVMKTYTCLKRTIACDSVRSFNFLASWIFDKGYTWRYTWKSWFAIFLTASVCLDGTCYYLWTMFIIQVIVFKCCLYFTHSITICTTLHIFNMQSILDEQCSHFKWIK